MCEPCWQCVAASQLCKRSHSVHGKRPDGARYYRKLARKQQQIWFGRVDASSNPELARDLGLKAVPSFVTFRGGEVVTATSTSSKAKIEKLVDELLYE